MSGSAPGARMCHERPARPARGARRAPGEGVPQGGDASAASPGASGTEAGSASMPKRIRIRTEEKGALK